MKTKQNLVLSLASYVSDDDVTLSREEFLENVADRIQDDLDAAERAKEDPASIAEMEERTRDTPSLERPWWETER